ncbi:MAG: hypothetical protein QF833_03760, partial [Alphaproteobacteria bacterium]|nr:hypothetical protein [Alphaproteobacteria bacterium]
HIHMSKSQKTRESDSPRAASQACRLTMAEPVYTSAKERSQTLSPDIMKHAKTPRKGRGIPYGARRVQRTEKTCPDTRPHGLYSLHKLPRNVFKALRIFYLQDLPGPARPDLPGLVPQGGK